MDPLGTIKFILYTLSSSHRYKWISADINRVTDTAGSALDYLEDFRNRFISISDNQSSHPAHLLMSFTVVCCCVFVCFLKQTKVGRNCTLLPQDQVIRHGTLTVKSSSCIHVPFLPWWWTEFQPDCSAFNFCVVTGIQCLFSILGCGKFYKCIPIWKGRFQSAWEAQHISRGKAFTMPTEDSVINIPFRPALVVLWHLDGSSFFKQFLQSFFWGSIGQVVHNQCLRLPLSTS